MSCISQCVWRWGGGRALPICVCKHKHRVFWIKQAREVFNSWASCPVSQGRDCYRHRNFAVGGVEGELRWGVSLCVCVWWWRGQGCFGFLHFSLQHLRVTYLYIHAFIRTAMCSANDWPHVHIHRIRRIPVGSNGFFTKRKKMKEKRRFEAPGLFLRRGGGGGQP